MLFDEYEYDYDMDIKVHSEEAKEEGIAIGINEGMAIGRKDGINEGMARVYYTDMHLPVSDIAQRLGISTKDVEGLLSSQGLLQNLHRSE